MLRRKTQQKEAILQILRKVKSHPTADAIYDEVRKKIPNISKGTVYRNLKILQEDGEISVLNYNGSMSRYEGNQSNHYHFRCEKCGKLIDLEEPIHDSLNERITKQTGLKVSSHHLEFRGLCHDCQK